MYLQTSTYDNFGKAPDTIMYLQTPTYDNFGTAPDTGHPSEEAIAGGQVELVQGPV